MVNDKGLQAYEVAFDLRAFGILTQWLFNLSQHRQGSNAGCSSTSTFLDRKHRLQGTDWCYFYNSDSTH